MPRGRGRRNAGQRAQGDDTKSAEADPVLILKDLMTLMALNKPFIPDSKHRLFVIDGDNPNSIPDYLFTILVAAASSTLSQVIVVMNQTTRHDLDRNKKLPLNRLQKLVEDTLKNHVELTLITVPTQNEASDAMIKLIVDSGYSIKRKSMKPSEQAMFDKAGTLWNLSNIANPEIVLVTGDKTLASHINAEMVNEKIKFVSLLRHTDRKLSPEKKLKDETFLIKVPNIAETDEIKNLMKKIKQDLNAPKGTQLWTQLFNLLMQKFNFILRRLLPPPGNYSYLSSNDGNRPLFRGV